jgi:hypothetical protein
MAKKRATRVVFVPLIHRAALSFPRGKPVRKGKKSTQLKPNQSYEVGLPRFDGHSNKAVGK